MSGKPETLSSLMAQLEHMSDADILKWLAQHPVSGGEHDDEDEDEDEDDSTDEDEDDGTPAGKKGKSDSSGKGAGKLYTKEQLDDIVEKSVKERLAREQRAKNRSSAKDKGEFETLASDLQREIDEEWKPKAEALETLEARVEDLEAVIHEQVESILETLPQDLADLDLGDDEDPAKRLRWLITKVLPKAAKRKPGDNEQRGNPPSPAPKNKQGTDAKKPINAPVGRRRF